MDECGHVALVILLSLTYRSILMDTGRILIISLEVVQYAGIQIFVGHQMKVELPLRHRSPCGNPMVEGVEIGRSPPKGPTNSKGLAHNFLSSYL